MATIGHEWFPAETIKLREPVDDVGEDRFHENPAADTAHADAVPLEPELPRQSDRLTPAIPKKLGGCPHQCAPLTIYTVSIYLSDLAERVAAPQAIALFV
jgi:hypothetical protein